MNELSKLLKGGPEEGIVSECELILDGCFVLVVVLTERFTVRQLRVEREAHLNTVARRA